MEQSHHKVQPHPGWWYTFGREWNTLSFSLRSKEYPQQSPQLLRPSPEKQASQMFSFENQWSSHTQDPKGCSDLRSGSSRPGAGPFLLRVPCEAAGCWVTRLHVVGAGLFVLELWPEEQASEEACHQLGTVSGSLSQPGSHPGSIFFLLPFSWDPVISPSFAFFQWAGRPIFMFWWHLCLSLLTLGLFVSVSSTGAIFMLALCCALGQQDLGVWGGGFLSGLLPSVLQPHL